MTRTWGWCAATQRRKDCRLFLRFAAVGQPAPAIDILSPSSFKSYEGFLPNGLWLSENYPLVKFRCHRDLPWIWGRVDFYIPAKGWGVELLRNGDRLAEHSGCFSQQGSYAMNFSFSDYIILEYRSTTNPRRPHPGGHIYKPTTINDWFRFLTYRSSKITSRCILRQLQRGYRSIGYSSKIQTVAFNIIIRSAICLVETWVQQTGFLL